MRKLAIALIAATTFAAAPAHAMDCGAMLDSHMTEVGKMSKATPEKRAALRRMALQGYDHCMAGDAFNAEKFFKMIMLQAG